MHFCGQQTKNCNGAIPSNFEWKVLPTPNFKPSQTTDQIRELIKTFSDKISKILPSLNPFPEDCWKIHSWKMRSQTKKKDQIEHRKQEIPLRREMRNGKKIKRVTQDGSSDLAHKSRRIEIWNVSQN